EHAALRRHAPLDAAVLQLVAIHRVRVRRTFLGLSRDGQPYQQAELGLVSVDGRFGAAVARMAMRAAVFVERRTQTPYTGWIRCHDPGFVELLFAHRPGRS